MKKAYVILIAVLIVVVAAFTIAKSYLSRLSADAIILTQELKRQELVDSLHHTYRQMLAENRSDLQIRFDSLCAESNAMIYALESQLDLYINSEYDPLRQGDSVGNWRSLSGNESDVEAKSAAPIDYEIYIQYLEMVTRLPGDLSSYEKRVEVSEIKKQLMKSFSIDSAELEKALVGMRERGRAMAESD